jgi:prevent-host-death family protein
MSQDAHSSTWPLLKAKNRLSEVIKAAQPHGPQTITRYGRPVAIVIPIWPRSGTARTAWDLLRDDLVDSLGGPPVLPQRHSDPTQDVPLPG